MPGNLPKKEFETIYSRVPRLCVEVIVKNSQGIVLTKRSIEPYKGKWHIPGGTVLYGEMLHTAVKRVATEELGVEVNVKKVLGYIEYPSEAKIRGFGWSVGIAFEVEIMSGELRGSDQAEEVQYFTTSPDEIVAEQNAFLKKHGLF